MSRNNHHVARKSRAFFRKKTRPLLATPEQLESRTMMAGDAFKAVNPWDTQFGGAGIYDAGFETDFSLGKPLMVLPVPGKDEILMLYGSFTNPTFKKFDSTGKETTFNFSIQGTIKELTPLENGTFIVCGSVEKHDIIRGGGVGGIDLPAVDQTAWLVGPGFTKLYAGGNTDGFVAQIDFDGQLLWSTLIGGLGNDVVNSVTIAKMGTDGTDRLVLVGSTTSDSNFMNGGDTVLGPYNDGFVMVLGNIGLETSFSKHLWSSYTSPADKKVISNLCPKIGAFSASAGTRVRGHVNTDPTIIQKFDDITIFTNNASLSLIEIGDSSTPKYQFDAILNSPPFIPTEINSVQRGGKIYYTKAVDPLLPAVLPLPTPDTAPSKGDPENGILPTWGESAEEVLQTLDVVFNPNTKFISYAYSISIPTKFSMKGFFIDPFNSADKTRDFIYYAGTAYGDPQIDLSYKGKKVTVPKALPWGGLSYQQGYADPVIAKSDLLGNFKSIQFISSKRTLGSDGKFDLATSPTERGMGIGITGLSETLLFFADKYSQPAPGSNRTQFSSSEIFRYSSSNKVSSMSVENANNQQTIPDNTNSATTNLGTDFGKTQKDDPNPLRLFTIKNSGESALVMETPILPNGFSIVDPSVFSTPIPPGSSRNFEIALLTREVGLFNGDFSVANNDPTKNPYNFSLKGEIVTELLPSLQVSNVSAFEGNVGNTPLVFNVILSKSPAQSKPVTIAWTLLPGTATPGTDYIAASGTLQFTSTDSLTKQISVSIRGDRTPENDETFRLVLSSPVNVILDSLEAVGTILTDEALAPLTVGFSPASLRVVEGQAGLTPVSLSVQLSQQSSGIVTVNYSTTNGTAIAGSDYTASSGTIRFMPGETQKIIALSVFGDSTAELNETFNVRLTSAKNTGTEPISIPSAAESAVVTIINDDGALPLPKLTVSPASVIEGNSGSPKLSFTITLASAISANATLSFRTSDGTAKAGIDYTSRTGTFTILAGRTTAIITVNVIPNRIVDGNRTMTFSVLSNALEVARGTGTIRDDDRASATSQLAIAAAFSTISSPSQSVTKKK